MTRWPSVTGISLTIARVSNFFSDGLGGAEVTLRALTFTLFSVVVFAILRPGARPLDAVEVSV